MSKQNNRMPDEDEARFEIAEFAAIADAQAFQLSNAQKRIAELEAALRDIIEMNPRPTLPYGHQVNDRARAALAGDAGGSE